MNNEEEKYITTLKEYVESLKELIAAKDKVISEQGKRIKLLNQINKHLKAKSDAR